MIMMSTAASAGAEEYKFVDAEDETGYYVDMDTVKVENANTLRMTIAVVKANMNKMYVYDVRINHREMKYQINWSKIMEYDTRKELESNNEQRPYRPYSAKSQMTEVVNYVLNGE